jgi:hypothetical protein
MAIAACFVFPREISRSVFWDFFDSIGQTRTSPPGGRTSDSPNCGRAVARIRGSYGPLSGLRIATIVWLFDQLIGVGKQRGWQCKAQGLRSLEIDYELKSGGKFYR